jgi:hypothetical protein
LILVVQGRKPPGERSSVPESATRRDLWHPEKERILSLDTTWERPEALTSGEYAEMWLVMDGGGQMANGL